MCSCKCCGGRRRKVQELDDNIMNIEEAVPKTSIPYGFIDFYAGVPISNNTHSSPMLAVHLYRQAHHNFNTAQDNQTVVTNKRNQQKLHKNCQSLRQRRKIDVDMELTMIPVEDVLHISATAGVKKGLQVDITTQITPVYGLSENCCDRCSKSMCNFCTRLCCCCIKKANRVDEFTTSPPSVTNPNRETDVSETRISVPKKKECWSTRCINAFRCWCCRRKRVVEYIQKRRIDKETEAERVITVTIEYSKYSHPNTLSNARLLSTQNQHQFYKDIFKPHERLEFYLVNDTEYDPNNFAMKMKQTTDLCRTVMQMKGVKDQYPPNDEFFHILKNSEKRIIGNEYHEPELTYTIDSTFSQRPAIDNNRF